MELSRKLRLGILLVNDPLETMPTPPGRYALQFDDQRREWRVDDARQQQALPAVLGAGRDRLVALAKATGVPWRAVGTADDPFDALAALSNPRRHA